MKHLLKLLDLTGEEIYDILNLADQLKYEKKNGISHRRLEGKSLGMIFQKSSTRTRVSFEAGMFQLGGQALYLNATDMQIKRGEPVEDTARVLSRYIDGIMIRTFDQSEVEALATSVEDSGDVYFVPAFSGLFAPYWRPDARGTIVGLTRFSTKAHIARAALECSARSAPMPTNCEPWPVKITACGTLRPPRRIGGRWLAAPVPERPCALSPSAR